MDTISRILTVILLVALPADCLGASQSAGRPNPSGSAESDSSYVLGPDDVILIRALDAAEIADKPIRIGMSGNIRLPLVGRVHASGLTVEALERELNKRLKVYVQDPQAAVSVTEYRSQPVSVIGAVRNPGVQQLEGHKTLVEMLSLAGGLADDAGYSVKITRRRGFGRIPLPNAEDDTTGKFSIAEVSVKSIMDASSPQENIEVKPYDVISVPRGQKVFVIGEVKRSGGFVLGEKENVSVLQALSMAEGLEGTAAAKNAKILRINPKTASRVEIAVDLKRILTGRAQDVPMQPDDILFVPSNTGKKVAVRTLESIVSIGSGVAIWRAGR